MVDVRVEELERTSLVMNELEKTSLSTEEHLGVTTLFSKYKPDLVLAELGFKNFTGV